MHIPEGAERGCRPRSVGLQILCSSHGLWRRNWEGSICHLTVQPSSPPPAHPLHTHLEGQLVSLGWTWALMAPLAPTAPPHVPSLHTKARLPSPHVLRSQGGVLRLQHSKLVGSKALSTTGKALMTLPTAKVLISFPSNPELKLASSVLKPRKVGLEL